MICWADFRLRLKSPQGQVFANPACFTVHITEYVLNVYCTRKELVFFFSSQIRQFSTNLMAENEEDTHSYFTGSEGNRMGRCFVNYI